ncbi:hypothetical protein SAMN05421840_11935 [Shewanella morhuae]|nr:hypothetical protein SAMN05421840_11935 [Shewanella morhuae]
MGYFKGLVTHTTSGTHLKYQVIFKTILTEFIQLEQGKLSQLSVQWRTINN